MKKQLLSLAVGAALITAASNSFAVPPITGSLIGSPQGVVAKFGAIFSL